MERMLCRLVSRKSDPSYGLEKWIYVRCKNVSLPRRFSHVSNIMSTISKAQRLQTTDTVFMVRPAQFAYNPQAAESNAFMEPNEDLSRQSLANEAKGEFNQMVSILKEKGIQVHVFDDTPEPHKPDSLFPNNWVSFHYGARAVLYPMEVPNRRPERRTDILTHFLADYPNHKVTDLSVFEQEELYLEGTGSMVLDRVNQIAYACISPRTDASLFARFCMEMEVEGVLFHANGDDGTAIYHTNVMMALGTEVAVVCLESITDWEERQQLIDRLTDTGHEIVGITLDQMNAFAGNMLELRNAKGEAFMVMSQRAYDSLDKEQIARISAHAEPLVVPIDVIEVQGGGSVRCMIAEVFV